MSSSSEALDAASPRPDRRALAWLVLTVPLVLLLIGVVGATRRDWPSFVGDEATYLMAAESLAWDFDLLYERGDYERFVKHWSRPPEGLTLQSGDSGEHMTFSKPFFYPAFLSPFVRVAPQKGPLIGNVVLLGLAAFMAARTLRRWIGPAAPIWIAVSLFSSVAFAYAYWIHADLFLMSITAISLSLVFSDPEGHPSPVGLFKWLIGGVLLAVVGFSRPFYLPLLVPAAFCAPRPRVPRLAAFWAGAVLLVLSSLAIHQTLGDSWTSYDGERAGFNSQTGYPEVEFPRSGWDESIHRWGNLAWNPTALPRGRSLNVSLWLWNSVYFGIGRHVGVLIYFLPLILGLAAGPKDSPRWALAVAIVAAVAGAFLLRPFNFFGGGPAIANRFFLPLYPAFWFLAGGPLRMRWLAVVVVASAPALFTLWAEPGGYLLRAERTYRFVSPLARIALPLETTQEHLQPSGLEDLIINGLWVRPLDPQFDFSAAGHLTLESGTPANLLIGATKALEEINLLVEDESEVTLRVNGAKQLSVTENQGMRRFRLRLGSRRARHPMWWSWEPATLYTLEIEFQAETKRTIPFSVAPVESPTRSHEAKP